MTTEESLNELQGLRSQVLDKLGGMVDQLAGNDSVGFEALLSIARSTGRPEFLKKAYEQCQKIPDSPEKADAMLELLDEIEVRMAVLSEPEDVDAENHGDENAAPTEGGDQTPQ